MSFLSRMTEDNSDRELRKFLPIVKQVLDLEENYRSLSDEELFSTTARLKELIKNGISRDKILPHAFAACREATYRRTGKMQYPSQILAAIAMDNDAVAEMMTGQGKSLVIPLKAYLDSLYGKVNVVTSNDYLAERDSNDAQQIFDALGITISHVASHFNLNQKRTAYKSDIIYSTVQQLGFDYLRDNLAKRSEDKIMPTLDHLIIDEMDSILFDQGMTPLVLSGEILDINQNYLQKAKELADSLIAPLDPQLGNPNAIKRVDLDETQAYENLVDFYFSKDNSPVLTESGIKKIEDYFGISSNDKFQSNKWVEIYNYVLNALTARDLQKDDRYIVKNGKIILIDKTTDRKLLNNNFSYGLHQALEAKENLDITPIRNTDSSITITSFIKKFKSISGTSGTAYSEYDEFVTQYGKSVVKIPHYMDLPKEIFNNIKIKLSQKRYKTRIDHSTTICQTKNDKYSAIIDQIIKCNLKGQPVLIGTTSIEESEILNNSIIKLQNTITMLYSEMEKNNLLNKNSLSLPLNDEQKKFITTYLLAIKDPLLLNGIKSIIQNGNTLSDIFKLNQANLNLLNAKNDKIESYIISNAGKSNSITISTNMAGRGTDIPLGGAVDPKIIGINAALAKIKKIIKNQKIIDICLANDDEELTDPRLKQIKKYIDSTIEFYIQTAIQHLDINKLKQQVHIEKQKVIDNGGLFVIGSSYHNSRRINDQLRGRAGRQTDKGESKFFVSLEDSLLLQLDPNDVNKAKQKMIEQNISHTNEKNILQLFEKAQTISEANATKERQDAAQFDSYIDICRTGFYQERDTIIEEKIDINDVIDNMVIKIVSSDIDNAIENNELDTIIKEYSILTNTDILSNNLSNKKEIINIICELIKEQIISFDQEYNLYLGKENASSQFKRTLLLNMMDKSFQEFINNDVNDIFQQIGLLNTGGGNKDPKVEFAIMLSQKYEKMTMETRRNLIKTLIKQIQYYHNKNEKLGKNEK